MKFAVALLAVSMCLLGAINALPNERYKRAVSQEPCPMDVSCETYAQDRIKQLNSCVRYEISSGTNFPTVEWQSCGVVQCAGDLKLGKEDLSKPYPDCCAKCE